MENRLDITISGNLKRRISEKNLGIMMMNREVHESQVRTVSGFQEFTHNGKESICEENGDQDIKIYLRRYKK